MKKIIQRNLRLDTKYSIQESYYTELENGVTCDNCGKHITNCCIVKDKDSKVYTVGMDCAATLSGITDSLILLEAQADFSQAKQARAKIMSFKKKFPASILLVKTFMDTENYWKEIGAGMWSIEFRDHQLHRNWQSYPKVRWEKFILPMITSLIGK